MNEIEREVIDIYKGLRMKSQHVEDSPIRKQRTHEISYHLIVSMCQCSNCFMKVK